MGNNLEAVYDKKIPKHLLPVEYLPDDYTGPNNGSLRDLISQFLLFKLVFFLSVHLAELNVSVDCRNTHSETSMQTLISNVRIQSYSP